MTAPQARRVVTVTLDFDGGRKVTANVPAATPEAVVYAGDGQLVAPWGSLLEGRGLPPVMVVGADRLDDEMARIREYSPGESTPDFTFDPERFVAHESFFVNDLRAWVRKQFGLSFPAAKTAVFGVSAGGELALAMGIRHPRVYGAVLCASPGAGYVPPATLSGPLPRAYFVAGKQEPFFVANAARWAEALRDAGAEVTTTQRDGAHGDPFWEEEFPRMVAWAFAP